MTSENSPPSENEALSKKIGAIEQEIAAVKTAIRWSSRVRLVVLLLVIAFLGGSIWAFYNLAMQFKSKENIDLLVSKVKDRVEESRGQALKDVQGLVDHCKPVLQEAFTEQVKKDTPKYTALLEDEKAKMMGNLEVQLREKILARQKEAGEKYQAIIREEFPDAANPELGRQLYENIEQIMEKLVQKYYNDDVQSELQELGKTWEEFDMADLPGNDEHSLQIQLVASLLQLAADKLNNMPVKKLDMPVKTL
jgi:multidrug efflux pump subunit AcrB